MEIWLARLYGLLVAGLSVYGFFGLLTFWLFWRHRHETFPCPGLPAAEWPAVTVQLPIYNEQYVVKRLIEAAAALDYPLDRLQIQVIDDSTDDTADLAAEIVACYRARGWDIQHIRRDNRQGYKAGALAAAMSQVKGEFIAFFDADFEPPSDFLRRTLPHFHDQPRLGVVQARWEHLNSAESALTAAQAIALDKHFAMEQVVRHRADLFPKFNGSAGVWRRTCLEESGGWHDDTLCEDLCLSIRAALDGWRFLFLNDVTAPAEIPSTIAGFKSQQARWATGVLQCLVKYFRPILFSRQHRLAARLYALVSMSVYLTYLFALALLLIQIPILWLDVHLSSRLAVLSIAGFGQPLLFVASQKVLYPDWKQRLRYFPIAVILGMGIAPNQSRALLRLLGRYLRRATQTIPFVRTPKGQPNTTYRQPFDWIIVGEAGLALYAVAGIVLAISLGHYSSLVLLSLAAAGLGYVAWLGFREQR